MDGLVVLRQPREHHAMFMGARNEAHSTSLHREVLRHKDGDSLWEGAKGKASALKFRKKDRKEISNEN